MGILKQDRRHFPLVLGAVLLLPLLSACQQDDNFLELGEYASIDSESGEALFSIAVQSAEHSTVCPSRVEPGTELPGNFLILQVAVDLVEDPPSVPGIMSTQDGAFTSASPEQFLLLDDQEEIIGGLNLATTWECFSAEELLPAIILEGESAEGIVVLEVTGEPAYITFQSSDGPVWQWKL